MSVAIRHFQVDARKERQEKRRISVFNENVFVSFNLFNCILQKLST